ncbi:MAG: histidine phosphatase family protein [Bacteriovoracia bacterium]
MDPRIVAKEFYFFRHAATDLHAKGLACGGGSDVPLSEAGLQEARAAAKIFRKNPQKIKTIFSSSLLRAIQTADIVHDVVDVKLRVFPHFAERHLGDWEGKPVAEIEGFSAFAPTIPRGEAYAAFEKRVGEGLVIALGTAQVSLIVSHGFVAAVIQRILGAPEVSAERCRLLHFTRGDAGWSVRLA